MSKPKYLAEYVRDNNDTWFVKAPEVSGAHSHGRTLSRARENIREAVGLVLDVAEDSFEIVDRVQLPADIRRLVDSARELRVEADELQQFAAEATADVVKTLSFGRHPLSLRDTAQLLGISFQRVQQLRNKALAASNQALKIEDEQAAEDDQLTASPPDTQILDLMEALLASVRATRIKAAEGRKTVEAKRMSEGRKRAEASG
jgi:predicted RNase H-like HicB family nuclease